MVAIAYADILEKIESFSSIEGKTDKSMEILSLENINKLAKCGSINFQEVTCCVNTSVYRLKKGLRQ